MSASDKKKLRHEQETAALTDKQLSQKKEDKQLRTYTMTFVVVMILVVSIAVTSVGMNWYNASGIPANSTVALTVDGTTLSNVDLNYYFVDTVNQFYSDLYDDYSSYTSFYALYLYGLDMSTALNAQLYNEDTGETWADYFLTSAIDSATSTYVLYNAAMDAGFELPDDYKTSLATALANLVQTASYYKYSSVENYLKDLYGAGASEESYVNYYTINATAEAYYSAYAEELTYTDEEIEKYNTENYDNFSLFDYSYFYVAATNFLPEKEAETSDSDETTEATTPAYTDEEVQASILAAEVCANELAKNKDIDSLNAAITAQEWTAATAKATEIDGYTIGSIATLYGEWIVNAERKAGDTTVIAYESSSDEDEDVDGYYVVLFQGRTDYLEKMRSVRHMLAMFEGGTEDEDGNTVYSDEEKAAAKAAAQAVYDQWLSGDMTEESFAALVSAETSDDGGSNTTGGLYTNIYRGAMVENFDNWVFDASRKPGDHEIIETEIGYHIMYFVEEQDQSYREYLIEYTLKSEDAAEWYEELEKNVETKVGETKYMSLNLIIAPATSS